eukprot:2616468-Amphidinium_carterae.1
MGAVHSVHTWANPWPLRPSHTFLIQHRPPACNIQHFKPFRSPVVPTRQNPDPFGAPKALDLWETLNTSPERSAHV